MATVNIHLTLILQTINASFTLDGNRSFKILMSMAFLAKLMSITIMRDARRRTMINLNSAEVTTKITLIEGLSIASKKRTLRKYTCKEPKIANIEEKTRHMESWKS
jgi:hypothetical protein